MGVFISDGCSLDDDGMPDAPPPKRQEELFVSEDYKIFMIAGRPDSFTRDNNHICVRPFKTFPAETVERMRAHATPYGPEAKISIRVTDTTLDLTDGMNGVTSKFPISELDEDVREDLLYHQRIRVFNGSDNQDEKLDPWQKYAGLDEKSVKAAVTSDSEIKVSKPLALKKPGLAL